MKKICYCSKLSRGASCEKKKKKKKRSSHQQQRGISVRPRRISTRRSLPESASRALGVDEWNSGKFGPLSRGTPRKLQVPLTVAPLATARGKMERRIRSSQQPAARTSPSQAPNNLVIGTVFCSLFSNVIPFGRKFKQQAGTQAPGSASPAQPREPISQLFLP